MVDFRSIVGPSQTVDVTPPQRVLASGETDPANVVFVIKGGGSPKSLARSRSYSWSGYMEKQQKEVSTPTP